ncbi:MAG: MTH1187 family thiamine-binding protein [Tissierellia bacterium]|nr:MTH1187 family thiamine-binding protein [Tissierellia bacterium]
MAVMEISIVPIGTKETSVSKYVAEAYKAIKDRDDINVLLTPMGTTLEGELKNLYEAAQEMQEAVFATGMKRVYTVIKIDDRRDNPHPMSEKTKAVMEKL